MLYYIFVTLIIVLLIIIFVIPTIWCYDPTLLVNMKYTSNVSIKNFEKPSLFVCSFNNEAHHLDQILVCKEAIDTKLKLNIISHHDEAGKLSRLLKKLPLFAKYNLLYTKNNLIQRAKEKLKKEHVWLFLKDDWNSKGVYYILKDLNVPIIFVNFTPKKKINDETAILSKTFNSKINITYKKHDKYPIDKEPEEFMKWVKGELYN